MKKLHMSFKNSEDKKHTLRPTFAAEDLTSEEVKAAMDQICELSLFTKDNVRLYVSPATAKYVETIETVLF